jgi:predicted RND superfamily exporter protein
MTRAARCLIRRWPLLVAVVAVLTAAAALRAIRIELDFSFRHFFLDTAEDALAAEMRERFGDNAGSYLVAVLRGGDVFQREPLAAITAMSDAITDIPHVEEVYSLSTVPFIRDDEDALSLVPVAGLAADGVDPAGLRSLVLASPLYARRLVAEDGRKTTVLALLEPHHRSVAARAPTIAAFERAVLAHVPPGFEALFTGYALTEAEYARMLVRGFAIAQVAGLLLMAATLYATFRSGPAVFLPLATVGVATVLVLGLMQLSGQHLTLTNASVPLVMLVIGVAEVSFFVARAYEEALEGWDGEAVVRATASALWPGFIAAATTSAGFLALGSGHIGLTREFGYNMAVASLVTFAVAATLIPGALARLGSPPARALQAIQGGPITRLLATVSAAALARPRAVVIGAMALVVLGLTGAARVAVDQYATRELTGEHEIFAAQRVVDAELSGAFLTDVVVVDPRGGALTTPERLRDIESLQNFLAAQPEVVKSWSVADHIKEMNHAFGGEQPPGRRLPESGRLIAQYLLLLSSAATRSDLPTVLDSTEHYASIVLGTTDLGTAALRRLRARADAFVADVLGGSLALRFVGDYWEVSRGTDILASDQMRMTLSSFLLIFPLVGLLLRSWRLTLLCIPPNVLPVVSLGAMGFLGYRLSTATSIIIPVTIGITVDMTTHYLARAREEWLRDGSYAQALRRATLGTGWSMASSTLALVVGFLAFQIPAFQSFRDLGVLASWMLVVALLTNLILTPTLVWWVRPFGRDAPATRAAGSCATIAATSERPSRQ